MSERIDHATEAQKILDGYPGLIGNRPFDVAQVHATLAMVEQQRIMNILKLDEMSLRSQSYEPPGTVREALGL